MLDVGCGRGGTASLLAEQFGAAAVGVDLSPEAIAFCRNAHRATGARFEVGDAEHLPFDDESFDVVTNLESSHTYPDMRAFLGEVSRVLRPGGWFLHTDLLAGQRWMEVKAILAVLGLHHRRPTARSRANVLASCDEVAENRTEAFGARDATIDNFLAVPGSPVYEQMASGAWEYRIVRSQLAIMTRPTVDAWMLPGRTRCRRRCRRCVDVVGPDDAERIARLGRRRRTATVPCAPVWRRGPSSVDGSGCRADAVPLVGDDRPVGRRHATRRSAGRTAATGSRWRSRHDLPVGIDIEKVPDRLDLDALAELGVASLEEFVGARGREQGDRVASTAAAWPPDVTVRRLAAPDGYVAAVAAPGDDWTVEVHMRSPLENLGAHEGANR